MFLEWVCKCKFMQSCERVFLFHIHNTYVSRGFSLSLMYFSVDSCRPRLAIFFFYFSYSSILFVYSVWFGRFFAFQLYGIVWKALFNYIFICWLFYVLPTTKDHLRFSLDGLNSVITFSIIFTVYCGYLWFSNQLEAVCIRHFAVLCMAHTLHPSHFNFLALALSHFCLYAPMYWMNNTTE